MNRIFSFLLLISCASQLFCQQTVELVLDNVNKDFQKNLNQLFQDYVSKKEGQGAQVVISFADRSGEERVMVSSSNAPACLFVLNKYKVEAMKTRQIPSTKGLFYSGLE